MKRAAICISGHMRDYESKLEKLKEQIINSNPNYEFDIFISTWNVRNSKISHAYSRRNYENFGIITKEKIVEDYQPISIFYEDANDDKFSNFRHIVGVNITEAVFFQFYKLKQAGELLLKHIEETQKQYDWVIRIRPDVSMKEKLFLDEFDSDLIYTEFNDFGDWIQDKVKIMNVSNFKKYIEFFDNIPRLMAKRNTNIPEVLLYEFFQENKLPNSSDVRLHLVEL